MIPKLLKDIQNFDHNPRTSFELTTLMHNRGINMRYLGRIALDASYNYVRELAVREILSRSIKVLIRDGLSFLKEEPNGFNQIDIKKCILHYLNEVFTSEERQSSKIIWEFLSDLVSIRILIIIVITLIVLFTDSKKICNHH